MDFSIPDVKVVVIPIVIGALRTMSKKNTSAYKIN